MGVGRGDVLGERVQRAVPAPRVENVPLVGALVRRVHGRGLAADRFVPWRSLKQGIFLRTVLPATVSVSSQVGIRVLPGYARRFTCTSLTTPWPDSNQTKLTRYERSGSTERPLKNLPLKFPTSGCGSQDGQ